MCYLLINNIDGVSLRSPEAQATLADLASTGVVRVVASLDHVNAPLLWDKKLLARFNWCAPLSCAAAVLARSLGAGQRSQQEGAASHPKQEKLLLLLRLPANDSRGLSQRAGQDADARMGACVRVVALYDCKTDLTFRVLFERRRRGRARADMC